MSTQQERDAIELVGAFQKACIELGQDMNDDNHQIMIQCRLALIDALSGAQPAEVVGGWQPIETAPKDGQRLILWWGGKPVFAGWLDNSQCMRPWAGWQTPSLTPRPQGDPTHWQPLPPAPQPPKEPA